MVFFVKETKGPNATWIGTEDNEELVTSDEENYSFIFMHKYVASVFKCCFKPRSQYKRRILLILITMMVLNVSVYCK